MARKSLFATLLGVAVLAVPSAFADQGGIPHEGSNGQGRPADQTQGQAQSKALAKGHAKAKAKAHAKGHAKTQASTPTANTHAKAGKTTICHATGSATNPYVMITISNNAIPAHQRHQDGRDVIPANGSCPTTAASSQQQPAQEEQQQSAAPPTEGGQANGQGNGQANDVAGDTTSGSSAPTTGSSKSHGRVHVLGTSASGTSPSAANSAAATATRSSSSSGLPFTGTDAIIVLIAGLALLLLGLTARRAATIGRS